MAAVGEHGHFFDDIDGDLSQSGLDEISFGSSDCHRCLSPGGASMPPLMRLLAVVLVPLRRATHAGSIDGRAVSIRNTEAVDSPKPATACNSVGCRRDRKALAPNAISCSASATSACSKTASG